MQIPKVVLQVLPDSHVSRSTPAAAFGLKRPIRTTEAIAIKVMQERGEPRVPILRGNLPHAIQRT